MTHIYGWWDYDETDRPTMVNQTTGERLQYVGVVTPEDDPPASFWMRFDYESEDLRYPLLVELTEEPYQERPFWPGKGKPKDTLRIDHVRSAALWRNETNATAGYPPYGVWRRVDDCATDALVCWPGLPGTGVFPVQIIVVGGWLNGAWTPKFTRTIWVPGARDRVSEADQTTMIATEPFVMPLDTAAPSPWRFHNFRPEERHESRVPTGISDYVTLKNLRKTEQYGQPSGGYAVPAGEPLTGFEGRTAYMRSEDGDRVLFPSRGTDDRYDRLSVTFSFMYGDPDCVLIFSGRNESLSPRADWIFTMGKLVGGHRCKDPDGGIWLTEGYTGLRSPSHAVWRRLSWGVIDAWLSWKGTSARYDKWARELALVGTNSVYVNGCYLGGIWPNRAQCVAKLSDDGGV